MSGIGNCGDKHLLINVGLREGMIQCTGWSHAELELTRRNTKRESITKDIISDGGNVLDVSASNHRGRHDRDIVTITMRTCENENVLYTTDDSSGMCLIDFERQCRERRDVDKAVLYFIIVVVLWRCSTARRQTQLSHSNRCCGGKSNNARTRFHGQARCVSTLATSGLNGEEAGTDPGHEFGSGGGGHKSGKDGGAGSAENNGSARGVDDPDGEDSWWYHADVEIVLKKVCISGGDARVTIVHGGTEHVDSSVSAEGKSCLVMVGAAGRSGGKCDGGKARIGTASAKQRETDDDI